MTIAILVVSLIVVTWLLLAALEGIRREKEKSKAIDVSPRIQWPARKA